MLSEILNKFYIPETRFFSFIVILQLDFYFDINYNYFRDFILFKIIKNTDTKHSA